MSHFKMIHYFFQGVFLAKVCVMNIPSTFGQRSLKFWVCSLALDQQDCPCIFTSILSSSKSFKFNFRGNFLHTSVPTALHRAAYAEIWDWKSTLHHSHASSAATRGQWLCKFQSSVFHPQCTDMAPQAHLPDTIWRLKIRSTDQLPGHPESSDRGQAHFNIDKISKLNLFSPQHPLQVCLAKLRQECPMHLHWHRSYCMGHIDILIYLNKYIF